MKTMKLNEIENWTLCRSVVFAVAPGISAGQRPSA